VLSKKLILPISYFAPIGYYALIKDNPEFHIEQHEYFIKQTLRNRCLISSANGPLFLTIPKQRKSSSKTLIKDLKICYNQPWQKSHWNSIKSSYYSSPFFEFYMDDLISFYDKKEKFLLDFNLKIHHFICKELEIINTGYLTEVYQNSDNISDLREENFSIKKQKKYHQVFKQRNGFTKNLSIIDLMCNYGPQTNIYLSQNKL
jgi:hypothetical protein|tara:strand:- start:18882 stop:19490 length:609 start_codon:yes stop_codon:yes gene_type:complete